MSNAEEEDGYRLPATGCREGSGASLLCTAVGGRPSPRKLLDELVRRTPRRESRGRSSVRILEEQRRKARRPEALLEDLLLSLAVLGIDPDLYVGADLRTHLRVLEQ